MKHIQIMLLALLSSYLHQSAYAQCSPDITPPVAVCDAGLAVDLDQNGELTIWASDIDEGSYDACTAVNLFIEEGTIPSPTAPTTESLDFGTTDIGSHTVILWVIDSSGNENQCFATLEVGKCQGIPNLACNDMVQISLDANGMFSILPEHILEGGPYCYQHMGIDFVNGGGFPGLPVLEVGIADIGIHTVAIYNSQNGNACWGSVNIQNPLGGPPCNPDETPPVAVCDENAIISLNPSGQKTVAAQVFDDGSYDFCTSSLSFFVEFMPASPSVPSSENIVFDTSHIGINQVVLWAVDQAGNTDNCIIEVEVKSCFNNTTLVCNAYQTAGIPASGSIDIHPSDMLEGGPYCNPMGIGLLPNSTFPGQPFVTLDTLHIGTVQQMVIYDLFTGSSCWGEIEVIDCTNDTIKPTPYCFAGFTAEVGLDVPHELTIWGTDFDAGSFDNCSANLDFRIEEGSTASAQAPSTASLTFNESEIGLFDVVVWVIDEAGNEDYCLTSIEIIAPNCISDNTPPICTAPANTSISLSAYNTLGIDPNDQNDLEMYFGQADADDNCGVATIIKSVELINNGLCGLTTIKRNFVAIDSSGNSSQTCTQLIDIEHEWTISVPADFNPGDPAIDSMSFDTLAASFIGVNWTDMTFDVDCDNVPDRIIRQWTAINWCFVDTNDPVTEIPRLDTDGDGEVGDAYNALNTADSVYLLENGLPTIGLGIGSFTVSYTQILTFTIPDTLTELTGTVFSDDNSNCAFESGEGTLAGWTVIATGLVTGTVATVTTDSLGYYEFDVCPADTLVEISLDVPFNYGGTCGTTHTVAVPTGLSQAIVQDIPVKFDTLCPILQVDIATAFLRRCFDNKYNVSYCNYSNETVEEVYVEVQLDPLMSNVSSNLPTTDLGNGLYSFEIGNLAPGECGTFAIDFNLSCNATLSATHCVEAHIYPDTLCPNPVNWSGANIEVAATCVNDTVFMEVKNTGNEAMAAPLEYIVVEDFIMLQGDDFNLAPQETHPLDPIVATGATYRLEAEQEPGHPYPGNVAAAVEGCNGINIFGLINMFCMENPSPFIATDCRQNIGAFDPNDKQAFPTGYQAAHFIEQNTDLEYLIRFQNTGTDTAFNVRILDELDPSLNPATVRPGAASHPYHFELVDGNLLRFSFSNIMLPDSNTNEAASHGFVQFSVSQKMDVPLGTVIENDADIYFDFNDPVTTNLVFHTIGDHFIEVSTDERPAGYGQINAYPNPSAGDVFFAMPINAAVEATFKLYDALGQQVLVEKFNSNKYRLTKKALMPGVYFYKIEVDGIGNYTGKVMLSY